MNQYLKLLVRIVWNGLIIDIYGFFGANDNDASIMTYLLKTRLDLKELILPGDILILDRGFRDAIGFLSEKYQPKIPSFYSYFSLK